MEEGTEERPGEGHQEKPENKVSRRRPVRVAEGRNKSVVVEVKGGEGEPWYRSVVPTGAVSGEPPTVRQDDLDAGRYGEDWARLTEPLAKEYPRRLAEALREQGIFSFEELRAKVPQAKVAHMTALGHVLTALLQTKKEG